MRFRNLHFATWATILVAAITLIFSAAATFTFADDGDAADVLEPQHGIPLVIVKIDESEDAIAAMNAEIADDPSKDYTYGTIEDMNASENHSVRCVGNIEIKVPEGYALPEGDLSWVGKDLTMDYIRGRGNSTWQGVPKHPYKIKLSSKADLFGMGKSKEWALMANYFDKTVIHNRITYWLGMQLGMPYTPESVPVDVVMVGAGDPEYLGCYDLSETIKIEKTRVNIDELGEEPDDPEAAEYEKTGGYLFSIFSEYQKDDPESNTFTTNNNVDFHFDEPEFWVEDELNDWQKAQRQYLRDYVQDVEDLIIDSEEIDEVMHEEIDKVLDLRSVADYWLIQEFTVNGDAYATGSTYFYKPRGDKMYFGPLWDFDLSWSEIGDEEEYVGVEGFNHTFMPWIDDLRAKDPMFVEIIKEEWAKLDPALTELTKSGGIIDQYREEVRAAYAADPIIAEIEDADIDKQTEGLSRWTDARHEWFAENEDKFGAVYATVTYVADGETVFVNNKVKIGTAPCDDPEAPDKEGYYFTGWFAEDGTEMTEVEANGDVTLYAKYVDEEHAVLPTDLYLRDYELYAEVNSSVYVADEFTILPSDAVSLRVKWTSSDESIATVDPLGIIYTHAVGDVTITAATVNGIERQIILHVAGELEFKDPEKIVIDEPVVNLNVGEHTQAKWHFEPEGEPINNDFFYFETSDDMVADVDRLGVITASGAGTAEITMEVYYGDGGTISTTFKVVVTDPNAPAPDKEKASATAKGTTHKAGGSTYKVLKDASGSKAGTVAFVKAANKKSVKVPTTVTIKHKKFNVTQINAKAFTGKKIRTVTIGKKVKTIKKNAFLSSKATKLIVTTKKLTKKTVKGSLRKSRIKRIQVKMGKKSVNKKYRNKYRKIFVKKYAGRNVRVV